MKRTVSSRPVTILGRGDLSPPRRSHRGRNRTVAVVLVLAVLAVAGWFGWRAWRGSGGKSAAAPRVCTTPTASASPAAPAAFTVAVLNSTPKQGLAHGVAAALRARGFHVGHVGNTKPPITAVAEVVFGPGLQTAAVTVAEQVPGGAAMSASPRPGIALVLGPGFRTLADAASVAQTRAHDVAASAPRPPVCTTP